MNQSGSEAPPTVKDVASHAGVSRATASRALADYGVVNSETRDRVRRSAEILGYVPNVIARSMRAGSSQTLGLIITEVGLSVFDLAMRVVIEAAHAQGYQVLVANTNENLSAERNAVRVMLEKQVDGVILVPSAVSDVRFLSPTALKGKPMLLLDRTLLELDLPSVTADNRGGVRAAVEHCVAHGHERIGLIVATANILGVTTTRPDSLVTSLDDRVEGYLSGITAAGLERAADWLQFSGDSGEAAILAARRMLAAPIRPSAVIASNANVSLAILSVAKELGLEVGRELSVIGFDDSPWASVMTPALTVIDLPIEQMAKTAVEMLIATIRGTVISNRAVVLPMHLIERASVATLVVGGSSALTRLDAVAVLS